MEQKTEKTIKINARQVTGTSKNGKPYDFIEYSGATAKGIKCKFKFTKNCKSKLPDKSGEYDMRVYLEDISRDNATIFSEYWVRDVIEITPHAGAIREAKPCEDF